MALEFSDDNVWCFSEHRREMDHDYDALKLQLQKQSGDVLSASEVLSALSCDVKTLHRTLDEQSQCWMQVWFCCLFNVPQ